MKQAIDRYKQGTLVLYTGPSANPCDNPYNMPNQGYGQMENRDPLFITEPVYKPYADHENKLVDFSTSSNTGVYSKFGKNSLEIDIFHEEHGQSHKDKSIGLRLTFPYDEM